MHPMSFSSPLFVRSSFVAGFVVLSAVGWGGCTRKDEPSPTKGVAPSEAPSVPESPALKAPSPNAAAPGRVDQAVKVLWTVPKEWKEMPERPMRKATYQAEGKDGPAEISVFYFGPNDGGGVDANITRWIGQFEGLPPEAAKRSENKVGELVVHEVRVDKGTFASGMPGAPAKSEEGWGMHAAVVETPAGNYFFKMLGKSEAVTEQEANFTALLQSMRVE